MKLRINYLYTHILVNLIVVSPNIVCNRTYIIVIIHYITFSALPFLNCTCFLVSTSQLKIQKENRASHLFIMNGASCIKIIKQFVALEKRLLNV